MGNEFELKFQAILDTWFHTEFEFNLNFKFKVKFKKQIINFLKKSILQTLKKWKEEGLNN